MDDLADKPGGEQVNDQSGAQEGTDEALHGSSTIPALIRIGDADVQLGTEVAAAHARSGMTVEAWNALSDEDRDLCLNHEIEAMRAAIPSTALSLDSATLAQAVESALTAAGLPGFFSMVEKQIGEVRDQVEESVTALSAALAALTVRVAAVEANAPAEPAEGELPRAVVLMDARDLDNLTTRVAAVERGLNTLTLKLRHTI